MGLLLWLSVGCGEPTPAQMPGGSADHEPLRVLAEGEDRPHRLLIDDRFLYWTTAGALRRMPLAGGAVTTLATGTAIDGIAVADGGVFFTGGRSRAVSRVDREGGAVTMIATGEWPTGIAVHDGVVYWSDIPPLVGTAKITRMGIDGSNPTVMLDSLTAPSGMVADDRFVYFTSTTRGCAVTSETGGGCYGGGVHKFPHAGGPAQLVDERGTPLEISLGPHGVYWMTDDQGPKVMSASLDDGSTRVLADVLGEDSGPIAADASAVYFSSSDRGRVMKLGLDGGKPTPIAVDLGTIYGIAVDEAWVYVAATETGRILRVAKDGSAAGSKMPVRGPCPMPVGTRDEIAATPRADPNLEFLALYLDKDRVTASEQTYRRVLADVSAIRAANPSLADIGFFPRDDGQSLMLTPNEMAAASIRAKQYSAWDCLNEFYGRQELRLLEFMFGDPLVSIRLKGSYNLQSIAAVYAKLPGIKRAEPDGFGGDASTICVQRDGSAITYVMDRRGGDCPAGCTEHDAHAFRSSAPGKIESLGAWNGSSNMPPPAWYASCLRRSGS